MVKKSLLIAMGVATFIGSGMVTAAGPVHPANNESGSVYHGTEYAKVDGKLARVDKWNMQEETGNAPRANDSWDYIGGEPGWQLRQPRFNFVNGRLVRTDTLPRDTPRAKVTADAENSYRDGHATRPR